MDGSVVCGVDGTPAAEKQAKVAMDLCARLGLRLVLAHAVPRAVRGPYGSRVLAEEMRRSEQMLHRMRESFKRSGGAATPADVTVELGRGSEVILTVARRERAALIVAGSTSRPALRRILVGSALGRLISEAACPVVVVPPGAPDTALEPLSNPGRRPLSIVCGIDDSSAADTVLSWGGALADRLGLRLVIAHAYGGRGSPPAAAFGLDHERLAQLERAEAREMLLRRVERRRPGTSRLRLVWGPAARALERLARQESAVMVVTGARGIGPLRALVRGSVSLALAASGTRPVVIVGPAASPTPPCPAAPVGLPAARKPVG